MLVLVVYDGKMWAVKGSVWNSVDGINWTRVLEKTPFGVRGYGETLVHDGKIWQLGSGKDVWISTNGIDWTCVCKDAPYGSRAAAAVVSFAGKLWVMGGRQPARILRPKKDIPIPPHTMTCGVRPMGWIGLASPSMPRGRRASGL
jgi:hypothetical protein